MAIVYPASPLFLFIIPCRVLQSSSRAEGECVLKDNFIDDRRDPSDKCPKSERPGVSRPCELTCHDHLGKTIGWAGGEGVESKEVDWRREMFCARVKVRGEC